MHNIFISYRRDDNQDATGRIYDQLRAQLKNVQVFKDVDSIPYGVDFRKHLSHEVGRCDILLAVVGQRWLDARDEAGKRRLDSPTDFVRIELEAALARGIPVVPVLVGNAPMPGEADLPPSLSPFVFHNAASVRPDPDFHRDMERLVASIRRVLDELGREGSGADRSVTMPGASRDPIGDPAPVSVSPVETVARELTETALTASREALVRLSDVYVGGPIPNAAVVARELHRQTDGLEVLGLVRIMRDSKTSSLDRYKAMVVVGLAVRFPSSKPYLATCLATLLDYGVLDGNLQVVALEAVSMTPLPPRDKWELLFGALRLANDAVMFRIVNVLVQVTPPAERQITGSLLLELLTTAQDGNAVRALCNALGAFNYRNGIPQMIEMVEMSTPEKADLIASVLTRWRVIEAAPAIRAAIEGGRYGTDPKVGSLLKSLCALEGSVAASFVSAVVSEALPLLQRTIIHYLADVSDGTIVDAIGELATSSLDPDVKKDALAFVEKKGRK